MVYGMVYGTCEAEGIWLGDMVRSVSLAQQAMEHGPQHAHGSTANMRARLLVGSERDTFISLTTSVPKILCIHTEYVPALDRSIPEIFTFVAPKILPQHLEHFTIDVVRADLVIHCRLCMCHTLYSALAWPTP